MPTIFSKIVKGEIPAHKIAETKDFLAFLDVRPVAEGHTLCIPKKEVDFLYDVDDEAFIGLQLFTKAVAKALHKAYPTKRIATAVIGIEVPHAHIHLIPISAIADLNFANAREADQAKLAEIAQKIRLSL
jgi:histidine triad (HIT) family protein